MKKLLTVLLSVLMVLTLGIVNVAAEGEEPAVTAWPEDVDIDKIGYRVVDAKAPNKEYNGERNAADIDFNLLVSGVKVDGLKKLAIDDLIKDLMDSKNWLDVIAAFAEERWESWDADYMVVYTQKDKYGHDVIVEPKDAGKYTATIIFRPLTATFDCSFLRKDLGYWHLSRYKSVDYVIDKAEYSDDDDAAYVKFNEPTANDLTVNGKYQELASAGEVQVKDGKKTINLPIEYSLDGNTWTKEIEKLQKKAAGTYEVQYRVNHDSLKGKGYNPNFVTEYGSINVTIKPSSESKPKRAYTPVATGY